MPQPNPALEEKPNLVILKLRELQRQQAIKLPRSKSLQYQPELSEQRFIEGIKRVAELANMNASRRVALYGSALMGLHYGVDLAELASTHIGFIKADTLQTFVPQPFESTIKDASSCLIYKGTTPAVALDSLLAGPSVIDCGMFCQLSLYMGIRYMLGDKAFDQVFGRSPLFITQALYQGISEPNAPHLGNPLSPFLTPISPDNKRAIAIYPFVNAPHYRHVHPGGTGNAHNTIRLADGYSCFSPVLAGKHSGIVSEAMILQRLFEAYNAPISKHDKARMALMRRQVETDKTVQQLLALAEAHQGKTLARPAWQAARQARETPAPLAVDVKKLESWLRQMLNQTIENLPFDATNTTMKALPPEWLARIPFENRTEMDFNHYTKKNDIQKYIHQLMRNFCDKSMRQQAMCVVLTGKAGVGKTASAVCVAKALMHKGKKVLWLSETSQKAFLAQAPSMEEARAIKASILQELADNKPDVVILDDDNLTGHAGKVLLEAVYAWYVSKGDKGLYITSNEPVSLEGCYGPQLDGSYLMPPFMPYASQAFYQTYVLPDINAPSMREAFFPDVFELDDRLSLDALRALPGDSASGVIVDAKAYLAHPLPRNEVDYVPYIDSALVAAMRRHLSSQTQGIKNDGTKNPQFSLLTACAAFKKLSPLQRQWVKTFYIFYSTSIKKK